AHVVARGYLHDVGEHGAVADVAETPGGERREDAAHVGDGGVEVDRSGGGAQLKHAVDDRRVVTVDEHGGQDTAQHAARVLVEPPHDPEVEEGESAVGRDEQVAGVDVAVEQPVHERGFDPGSHAVAHDRLEVVVLRAQLI